MMTIEAENYKLINFTDIVGLIIEYVGEMVDIGHMRLVERAWNEAINEKYCPYQITTQLSLNHIRSLIAGSDPDSQTRPLILPRYVINSIEAYGIIIDCNNHENEDDEWSFDEIAIAICLISKLVPHAPMLKVMTEKSHTKPFLERLRRKHETEKRSVMVNHLRNIIKQQGGCYDCHLNENNDLVLEILCEFGGHVAISTQYLLALSSFLKKKARIILSRNGHSERSIYITMIQINQYLDQTDATTRPKNSPVPLFDIILENMDPESMNYIYNIESMKGKCWVDIPTRYIIPYTRDLVDKFDTKNLNIPLNIRAQNPVCTRANVVVVTEYPY